GKGLDKIQIQRCFKVYNCNYDHYPTASLKELLQSLHIVSNDYDSLFEFEHFQTAANELKELLVLWSEYNKDVDANLPLFTSTQVREHIDNFTLYDKDNNGILDYWEFEPVGNLYFPIYKPITIFKRYSDLYFTPECLEFAPVIKRRKAGADGDDILNKTYSMSTAMFLNMKYFLIFGKKNNIKKVSTSVAMEETNEMPTNLTNVMANLNVTTEETNLRRNRGSRLPFFGCCGNP
ncbi:uncharacterized protein LOC126848029, partial [Adelges cooleyi]|uniref:uncharacterized protein LOC126848029 n=1 Tax=Adelges cooleyi TaxID=133065 RepID=UPI0021800EDB